MRKCIVWLSVFIISCNLDKNVNPIVCIELMQYYEPPRRNMSQPSVIINVKVEDTLVSQKIERGQLNGLVIYSVKKEDRNRFFRATQILEQLYCQS